MKKMILYLPVNGAYMSLGLFNIFSACLVRGGVKDLWKKSYMPVAHGVRAFTFVLGTYRGIELQKEF
jgi:hypothetical protein